MTKIAIFSLIILTSSFSFAQSSDNSRARYTCFRTDGNGNNPNGKVVILEQQTTDEIDGREFASGEHTNMPVFSVHIFKGIQEINGLSTRQQLLDVNTRELSDNLLSQVGSTFHENRGNYLEFTEAQGQNMDLGLGFRWNGGRGILTLRNGTDSIGTFTNRMASFDESDQGSMVCNPPDFIDGENDVVFNEETIEGDSYQTASMQ